MTNEELKAYLKEFITAENADKMGEVLSAIQAKDTEIESMKAENQGLKDKVVEMAFRMPITNKKEDVPSVEPTFNETLSIEQAIAEWEKMQK